MKKYKNFPKNFYWGASTSSHQVEGGNHNQWTVWELENATRLAKEAGGKNNPVSLAKTDLPIWPEIKDIATKPDNYVSGNGVEHYKRYKDDLKYLKKMNLNAYRFGIEWSRIEPKEGEWDEEAIKHYAEYIDEVLAAGIEPFLNILHWTEPIWFYEKGGFAKRSNIKYFERFVQKIIDEYGEKLNYIITINEANTFMSMGYLVGMWPPMKKNPAIALVVYINLLKAHKKAYKIIKAKYPDIQVGLAHQSTLSKSSGEYNLVEKLMSWASEYVWHTWFYNRARKYQDFVGTNFYQTNYFKWIFVKNPTEPVSDIGWYLEPYSVRDIILKLHKKYKKPILITENGVADMKDEIREWWIDESVRGMNDALDEGAEMLGYLHWSLLDNFEWAMWHYPE